MWWSKYRRNAKELKKDIEEFINQTHVALPSIRYALSEPIDTSTKDLNQNTRDNNAALMDRIIANCISSNEEAALNQSLSRILKPTFVDMMLLYMTRQKMTEPELYKTAHIDRRLFSKIASNRNYKLSRNTAIAITLALKLDFDDAISLLSCAGYAISHSDKRDLIIEYFLRNKINNILLLNSVLHNMNEKILGR